ncbi:SIR2 family protein [Methanobacterium sp. SMA-27]|uniref:SIR2 family protein n=1 Tax=Methanobacterium sp. SMA-27 TaxID=1495336 RepID=UPI001E3DB382|nr:SIR2 family protein [Methanobacterium sp. SMA-27]
MPVPELPQVIIDAINNKNLAIFMGAGVSQLVGCDGWRKLAENLVLKCFNTKKNDEESFINENQKEVLLKSISKSKDFKKVISICYDILKKEDENLFFEELEMSLKKDKKIESPNIYTEIYDMLHGGLGEISGLYITTNADEHFDEFFNKESKEIIFNPDDFFNPDIGQIKLYHIHGTISHRESLVFTVNQYLERYNPEKEYINVLKEIFERYVILFIGYGLGEFEVIDFLFTKLGLGKRNQNQIELKNFLLKGYLESEENDLEFDNMYYNNLGITVLGYLKIDEKDYEQLYNVIKAWNEEISDIHSRAYDSFKGMVEVIEEHERLKK